MLLRKFNADETAVPMYVGDKIISNQFIHSRFNKVSCAENFSLDMRLRSFLADPRYFHCLYSEVDYENLYNRVEKEI